MTSRTIARRIRESRSKRGRVDAPKQSTPTRADPTQHATSFGANHTVEVIERKKKSSNKRSLTKGFHLPYQSTMDALRCYHAVHGNLAMPRRFPVPEHPNYPKEWHGVDLASTVYEMKWWQTHVKQNPDRVAELNKLGFIWERLQPDWNLILEALVTYSSIHGDVMVPKSFNVPHGDKTWPKATWGIHLGRAVFQIRSRNDFMRGANAGSRRAQLDRIGFVWDVNDHLFRKFYYALRHFAKLERLKSPETGMYKPLRVPSTFVVPSGEENGWPEDFWDYPLGEKCNAVRSKKLYVKNNPERQAVLEELGFQWSGNATLGWLEVVHAAAIFSRMNNRNLDAPLKFVVPAPPHISNDCDTDTRDTCITGSDDAWPWPRKLFRFQALDSCYNFLTMLFLLPRFCES